MRAALRTVYPELPRYSIRITGTSGVTVGIHQSFIPLPCIRDYRVRPTGECQPAHSFSLLYAWLDSPRSEGACAIIAPFDKYGTCLRIVYSIFRLAQCVLSFPLQLLSRALNLRPGVSGQLSELSFGIANHFVDRAVYPVLIHGFHAPGFSYSQQLASRLYRTNHNGNGPAPLSQDRAHSLTHLSKRKGG